MESSRLKIWLLELRAPFFAGSALPVVLGTAAAYGEGAGIRPFYFLLALVGAVSLHGGTNVLNDYFDYKSGNDLLYREQKNPPFDGGSPFLIQGILEPEAVYRAGVALLAFGAAIGLFLAAQRGWPLLVLGSLGIFSGYFYVEPRLNLAGRGWGELAVGLCFGPLSVLGAYSFRPSVSVSLPSSPPYRWASSSPMSSSSINSRTWRQTGMWEKPTGSSAWEGRKPPGSSSC